MSTHHQKIRETIEQWGRRGREGMEAWFTYAISVYHHKSCELESRSWRGVFDTKLCDKVCQWLAAVRWNSPGTPICSIFKTDTYDITETFLKVTLNAITLTQNNNFYLPSDTITEQNINTTIYWNNIFSFFLSFQFFHDHLYMQQCNRCTVRYSGSILKEPILKTFLIKL